MARIADTATKLAAPSVEEAALAFLKEHFKGKARQLLEGG